MSLPESELDLLATELYEARVREVVRLEAGPSAIRVHYVEEEGGGRAVRTWNPHFRTPVVNCSLKRVKDGESEARLHRPLVERLNELLNV